MSYLYTPLEQHTDGAWWYHPNTTYNSRDKAEKAFEELFWWDRRPFLILKHKQPFSQDKSLYTTDFINFYFAGILEYTKD